MIVVGGDPVAHWRLAVVAFVDGAIIELVADAPSTSVVTSVLGWLPLSASGRHRCPIDSSRRPH